MFFACLTTASTLAKLFAEFLRQDICKNKISWPFAYLATISISFVLSNAGFAWIASFLSVILTSLYPALIVFMIASIINYFKPFPYIKHLFWSVLVFEVTSGWF
jgi:branched-chain amino acid:cation transporter, LIVCS family